MPWFVHPLQEKVSASFSQVSITFKKIQLWEHSTSGLFNCHPSSKQPELVPLKSETLREKRNRKQVPVGFWPSWFPVVRLIIPDVFCIMHKTICSLFLMSMNIKNCMSLFGSCCIFISGHDAWSLRLWSNQIKQLIKRLQTGCFQTTMVL